MSTALKKIGIGFGVVVLIIALLAGILYLRVNTMGAELGVSRDPSVVMKEVPCKKDYGGGRCGVVIAPLDYQGRDPGTIEVGFIYYPASNPFADEGRVVQLLAGGPGGAISSEATGVAINATRLWFHKTAILAIDPRGVGRSTRLLCPEVDKNSTESAREEDSFKVERCASEAGPTRVHYNTENAVRDYERVKRALGIGKIDLLGFSYGTHASIVYATLFPNEIRSVVLDGPYQIKKDLLFTEDFHAGLIRQFKAACTESGECSPAQGLTALGNVVATLREQPRPLSLPKRPFKLPENPMLDVRQLTTMTRFLSGSLADKH